MKKTALASFLAFLAVFSLAASDDVVRDLKATLDDIGKGYYREIVAGFGNFTYEYTPVGSGFSRYIEDRIAAALSGDPYYKLIMNGATENMDPEFQKKYADVFGETNVRELIKGRYFDGDDAVLLSLEVISLADGSLIGKRDLRIMKRLIPPSVSIVPLDSDKAAKTVKELGSISGKPTAASFSIAAQADRGNGAVYKDGEKLVIRLFSTRDAYVKLYHVDGKGNTKLIFPNKYRTDNFVPADTMVYIPDESYSFAFVLGSPYGTEYIKVVASTAQFADIEESFTTLGKTSRGLILKGIASSADAEQVEALVTYTIVRE